MKKIVLLISLLLGFLCLIRTPVSASTPNYDGKAQLGNLINNVDNYEKELKSFLGEINVTWDRYKKGDIVGLMYVDPSIYTQSPIDELEEKYLVLCYISPGSDKELTTYTINGVSRNINSYVSGGGGVEPMPLSAKKQFVVNYFPKAEILVADGIYARFSILTSFDYKAIEGKTEIKLTSYGYGIKNLMGTYSQTETNKDKTFEFKYKKGENGFAIFEHKEVIIQDKQFYDDKRGFAVDGKLWNTIAGGVNHGGVAGMVDGAFNNNLRHFYFVYFNTDIPMEQIYQVDLQLMVWEHYYSNGWDSFWGHAKKHTEQNVDITLKADQEGFINPGSLRKKFKFAAIEEVDKKINGKNHKWQLMLNAYDSEGLGNFWNGWRSSSLEGIDVRTCMIMRLSFQDYDGVYHDLPAQDFPSFVQPLPPGVKPTPNETIRWWEVPIGPPGWKLPGTEGDDTLSKVIRIMYLLLAVAVLWLFSPILKPLIKGVGALITAPFKIIFKKRKGNKNEKNY